MQENNELSILERSLIHFHPPPSRLMQTVASPSETSILDACILKKSTFIYSTFLSTDDTSLDAGSWMIHSIIYFIHRSSPITDTLTQHYQLSLSLSDSSLNIPTVDYFFVELAILVFSSLRNKIEESRLMRADFPSPN